MENFKLSVVNVNGPLVDVRKVRTQDKFETKAFAGLVAERLSLDECDSYSVRSQQDLIMLIFARLQDYDATFFNFRKTFFAYFIINDEFYSLMDFVRIFWKLNSNYFEHQTIILPHHDFIFQAHEIFQFRKTFCRRVFLPKDKGNFGLELMLRDIQSLIECDEFNEKNLDCLEHTTVISKASVLSP